MCLGMPGRIVELLDAGTEVARVDVGGEVREVSVSMLGLDGPRSVKVGEWVIVHLGLAMERIDEDEAQHLLSSLQELNDLYEQELR